MRRPRVRSCWQRGNFFNYEINRLFFAVVGDDRLHSFDLFISLLFFHLILRQFVWVNVHFTLGNLETRALARTAVPSSRQHFQEAERRNLDTGSIHSAKSFPCTLSGVLLKSKKIRMRYAEVIYTLYEFVVRKAICQYSEMLIVISIHKSLINTGARCHLHCLHAKFLKI